VFKPGSDFGALVDLLVLPGRLDIAAALIKDALSVMDQHGVSMVRCALPTRHPYNGVLHASGFFDPRRRMEVRVSGPAVNVDFLADPEARIHFTFGDTHVE
jgi:hypothetical protein